MRIVRDDDKRKSVFKRRGIDFIDLHGLLCSPYIEDKRTDDPEQYRIIGFARGVLATFIVEYREDVEGSL